MSEKVFAGIDESNNGTYPLIYTIVYSKTRNQSKRRRRKIEKLRDHAEISDVIGDLEFRYVPFFQQDTELLTGNQLKIIAFVELIRTSEQIKGTLDSVVLDGSHSDHVLRNVEHLLPSNWRVELKARPQGDEHYPIVNLADRLANLLKRQYGDIRANKSGIKSYLGRRVTPPLENYLGLLKAGRIS